MSSLMNNTQDISTIPSIVDMTKTAIIRRILDGSRTVDDIYSPLLPSSLRDELIDLYNVHTDEMILTRYQEGDLPIGELYQSISPIDADRIAVDEAMGPYQNMLDYCVSLYTEEINNVTEYTNVERLYTFYLEKMERELERWTLDGEGRYLAEYLRPYGSLQTEDMIISMARDRFEMARSGISGVVVV